MKHNKRDPPGNLVEPEQKVKWIIKKGKLVMVKE